MMNKRRIINLGAEFPPEDLKKTRENLIAWSRDYSNKKKESFLKELKKNNIDLTVSPASYDNIFPMLIGDCDEDTVKSILNIFPNVQITEDRSITLEPKL